MPANPLPSADYLRARFRYNPKSGTLFWRRTKERSVQWNGRFAGRRAGTRGKAHSVIKLGRKNCSVSRIIWKMVHDDEPTIIDHIDGNPRNNRLANLRAATATQNMWNTRRSNRTGYKGVTYHRHRRRWLATICVNGQKMSLGYFSDPLAAHEAYTRAANENFGKFAKAR